MSIVKGPFNFKWGANQLHNVSDISVDYSVETSDTTTLDGNNWSVQTGMSATVTLTLMENDVASLAMVLPQYYVAQGGTLSTGETVVNPEGAVDIVAASCAAEETHNHLDIFACGSGAQVLRLVNARTQVDSVDIGDGLRTVAVMFVGEPESGQGVIQFGNTQDFPIS